MMETKKWVNWALALSIFTIVYNIIEGLFAVYFGANDSTLALLGFGIDSFVEVISGLGIAHMVIRIKQEHSSPDARDDFERTALKITGSAFYLLTAGLVIAAVFNLIMHQTPTNTLPGVIVSAISILTMYALMRYKLRVGHKLSSDAIIADANCTKTCFYLSIILLASSGLFALWHVPYIDAIGSLGIAWFAFSEGRESWEKARSESLACSCC